VCHCSGKAERKEGRVGIIYEGRGRLVFEAFGKQTGAHEGWDVADYGLQLLQVRNHQ
jgi:hypothetical protein